MTADDSTDRLAELAALYAAGALPPDEAGAFEEQLAAGDAETVGALAELDPAVRVLFEAALAEPVPPHVREALRARVEADARSPAPNPPASTQIWRHWENDVSDMALFVRRATDAAWEPTGIQGIESRRLFVDREGDRITMMVRMAAGTSYPRHLHAGPEECYVLEGDLRVGDQVLRSGDYQRAAPGSRHPVQSTEGGCLLLIVSSLSDELE